MARTPSLASPRGSRVVLLVAVLLLTLGLVAVLAFEAYRADRSHRQVTVQVLQDYVRFAALELARHSNRVRFDPGGGQIVDAVGDLDPAALAAIERLLAAIPRGRLGGLAAVDTGGRPFLLAWRNYGAAAAVEVTDARIVIAELL